MTAHTPQSGLNQSRDGAESATPLSHPEHTIANPVGGMIFEGVSSHCVLPSLIYVTQMYPKNGSPLSLDCQLCFLPYLSSFLSLSLLRSHLNVPT